MGTFLAYFFALSVLSPPHIAKAAANRFGLRPMISNVPIPPIDRPPMYILCLSTNGLSKNWSTKPSNNTIALVGGASSVWKINLAFLVTESSSIFTFDQNPSVGHWG